MNNEYNTKPQKNLKFFGIGKVVPYLKKYRAMIFIMLLCSIIGSCIDIIVPLFQRYALNHFITLGTTDTLTYFIIAYIITIILIGIVNYFSSFYATKIEVLVDRDLRDKAFNHLQTLSFSYFNQNSVGYIHSRVMSDTSRIGSLVSWTVRDGLWHFAYLFGSIAVMLSINVKLTLMIITILPILITLFAIFRRKLIKVDREIRELNSKLTGEFNEAITGAKTIKSLVIEEKTADAFTNSTSYIKGRVISSVKIRGLFTFTMHFASSAALAIVLWQGGYIAKSEVGTFSMFMSYAQGMMQPIFWLVNTITDLITTQVNIERLTALFETKSDVSDTPQVIEKYGDTFNPKKENWEELHGDIEFKDVTFRYPDGHEYILEHFNLKIPFGSNIAIVGETGAGKSTLVNLVCRFFEPTDGVILIDGKDARERSQLWLHSSIGYVLQSPHLFSGTIRENLLYGNPNATDEDINRALETVSAKGIVDRLEKGIESDVGEGGDLLSTGEKQLISFARAILANPKILILDEATASVDTMTEQKIQKAISAVTKGRTSLVIAHRLSTVKNADCILVVKDGKIIEQGTHRELIDKKGYYHDLYTKQHQEDAIAAAFKQ